MNPLWSPSSDTIRATNIFRFLQPLGYDLGRPLDYAQAHHWSVTEPADFWSRIWDECKVIGTKGERVFVPAEDIRDAKFFPDAQLNFAENLLRGEGEAPAILFRTEATKTVQMSWQELHQSVAALADWMRTQGITAGDRVAAVMPNMPETVIAMLATASIGAVFSSCSPDFGEKGILDRFEQIEPKLLIATDGYTYGGKTFEITEKIESVQAQLPSLAATLIMPLINTAKANGDIYWADVKTKHAGAELTFERLPFDHPLYIMFSSGTTGKPKCIVHRAGGVLLQHLKEHRLHADVKPGDKVFYFTTCGWMMWNWLVSALAQQATLMLFDGSPFHPNPNVLWNYVAAEEATFVGLSAKYIDAIKKEGLLPRYSHDLSKVRTIASTGSPLVPESFDYVYKSVKEDVNLASISGGTDILSCFVLGNPAAPVWPGEIQVPGLGMAVEIWNDDGESVHRERGELVCTQPFPSMPLSFWDDETGEKYHAAYFDRFENTWCHGDFAIETEHGGYIIVGRSDATLNPGGVRIGTAEIYRQVEQFDEVIEAVAIGQEWQADTRVILFVVLCEGASLTPGLVAALKKKIRSGASPRHVPAKIISVTDIPRTKSGKITELAIRDVVHGRKIKNTEALANPEALTLYIGLSELETD